MIDLEKIKKEKPIEELIGFSILNIDKPSEWTSFDVVNFIRKELGLKKAGHFGTLDPNVTGVLPICLGKACKIQDNFMHRDKVYVGKMLIHKKITKKELEKVMRDFLGKIKQLPPRISRVKRVVREREIKKFKLLSFDEKKGIAEFYSEVQAGTYIRKLCSDLGEKLGVGAQMIELRRTRAGLFTDKDNEFITIDKFKEIVEEYKKENKESIRKYLIPAEIVVELMPTIEVKEKFLEKLKHGSPIFDEMLVDEKEAGKIIATKEPFCIVSDNRLIEIAKFTDKFEQKSILAKPETVL
jgi:H/ACA ribonucleoprotein complex subunit 4